MKAVSSDFFLGPTLKTAKALLGMRLITFPNSSREASGIIVEVEAYHQDGDRACHAYGGKTKRNAAMFLSAGHCYVYFVYGLHYCVNLVTEPENVGAAVLIRALEPDTGIEIMRRRRGIKNRQLLTNGPAKLCEALAIDRRMQAEHFLTSKLIRLSPGRLVKPEEVVCGKRIGISVSKQLKWRFYLRANNYVSPK